MIEDFIKIRFNPECQIFDDTVLQKINNIFSDKQKSKKNKFLKKTNFKNNSNINIKKNKSENKFIYILNKISKDNINELCIEYVENINITSINEYNNIIQILFFKMLKDIILCDSYITFFINIIKINKYKFNFNCDHFNFLCKSWIEYFYNENKNIDLFNDYDSETFRFNFLELIKSLIKNNFYNNKISDYISESLLNQTKYITDIHYWFKNNDKTKYFNKIKNIKTNNIREKLLIESLFEKEKQFVETTNDIEENHNNNDLFTIQVDNIIEEYKYLKMIDEIIFFINNECYDNNNKIRFVEIILDKYIFSKDNDLIVLLEQLLYKKILLKNNLSNGLKNIYKNNTNINNLKDILILFKNNNITKNIEHIYNKLNIAI
jgi:predicted RNase H-related nuclease YkuK (DUF458 family)